MPAVDATMPFEPIPASVSPRCRAWSLREARSEYTAIRSCTALTLHESTMRSRPSPRRSASSALSRAERTSASRITAAESRGVALAAFSSISRASSAWSRLPQFTPMRTGRSCSIAFSIIVANRASRFEPNPTLPGLMRYFASASAHSRTSASSRWPL